MKKFGIFFVLAVLVAVIATFVQAADPDATTREAWRTSAASYDERSPLQSPTNTAYAFDFGTATNGQVVTFKQVFAATPSVFLSYAEEPVALTTNLSAVSIGRTNFTVVGVAAKNVSWFAVGQK